MRIVFNIIYSIVFLILATGVMFVAGVSGVAGTFYIMVNEGNIETNLSTAFVILLTLLLLVLILRKQNVNALRRIKKLKQEAANKE